MTNPEQQRTPTPSNSAGAVMTEAFTKPSSYDKGTNFAEQMQVILAETLPMPLPSHKRDEVIPFVLKALKERTDNLMATDMGDILFYNGRYWENVKKIEVGIFLRDYAIKIGVPEGMISISKAVTLLTEQAQIDLYRSTTTSQSFINYRNCTLDFHTMQPHEHRKEDGLKYCLPYNYNPEAKHERWSKFLNEVLPDKQSQDLVQEIAGMPISRINTQKLPFLYGDGCNGKSVLLEVLSLVYGKENTTHYSVEQIIDPRGIYLVEMVGKLVNISAENGQKISDTTSFKEYVAREPKVIRKLYKQPTTTRDYPPTICSANNLPITDDHSNGFYRRFLFLPFPVTISKDKINPNLIAELSVEAEGIMNWILEGVQRLNKNERFTECEASQRIANEFRTDSDVVALFCSEKELMTTEDYTDGTLISELYNCFEVFCKESGYRQVNKRNFTKRLRGLNFKVVNGAGNKTYICAKFPSFGIEMPY